MVRKALSVLPTRPVLYIAPFIVVAVLAVYYWEQYNKCNNLKLFRASLSQTLASMDGSEHFHFENFTDFEWDKVRIVTGLKAADRNAECPFGWNWASSERESLMASGLLNVLIFGHGESIVSYAELRGDEVDFQGVETGLSAQEAVFKVEPNGMGVVLRLVE